MVLPWKEYIAAAKYNRPCINLKLAHHVYPPASKAFNREFVKYKYKNEHAMPNKTSPYKNSQCSFMYKGNKYVGRSHKRLGMIYKKA